jgi:hypothetical protein
MYDVLVDVQWAGLGRFSGRQISKPMGSTAPRLFRLPKWRNGRGKRRGGEADRLERLGIATIAARGSQNFSGRFAQSLLALWINFSPQRCARCNPATCLCSLGSGDPLQGLSRAIPGRPAGRDPGLGIPSRKYRNIFAYPPWCPRLYPSPTWPWSYGLS